MPDTQADLAAEKAFRHIDDSIKSVRSLDDYQCLVYYRGDADCEQRRIVYYKLRRNPFAIYGRFLRPEDICGQELSVHEMDGNDELCKLDMLHVLQHSRRCIDRWKRNGYSVSIRFEGSGASINREPCWFFEIRHIDEHPGTKHAIQLMIYKSLQLPARVAAIREVDGEKVVEWEYVYTGIKPNIGLSDIDFGAQQRHTPNHSGLASAASAGESRESVRAPLLFSQRPFDAAILADAVNYFVDLGESEAIRKLKSLSQKDTYDKKGFRINDRIGWVCRVLYEPKTDPLRRPGFGALNLPWRSMPAKYWPKYPIAQSGETHFVLSAGYSLAGKRETIEHYLEYCQNNGTFRTARIAVPSRITATRDVRKLRESQRWLAIKWKDSGPHWSYEIDKNRPWQFIARQAVSIPEQSNPPNKQ